VPCASGSELDRHGYPAGRREELFGYSLKRLGVGYIDNYRSGRADPNVPIEDTVGAIRRT
jgi:aryl-alcohol dehydrogenase-like predicted oxidoreductase